MSTESVMPSNHLILCHLLLPSPSILPSIQAYLISQLFALGCQSIGASTSASVFPMNIQDWFPLGLTGLISLLYKRFSRVFSSTIVWRHQLFGTQPSLWFNSHSHTWLLEKTMALTRQTFVRKVMSLLFNMLSRLVIAFLPKSRHLLISWPQWFWSLPK